MRVHRFLLASLLLCHRLVKIVSLEWWIKEYNGTPKASLGARLPTTLRGFFIIFFATRPRWLCLRFLLAHWFEDALLRMSESWFWVAWGTPHSLFQWIAFLCRLWWLGVSHNYKWCSSMWTFAPFGLWFLPGARLQSTWWSNPQWQEGTWFDFWQWEMYQVHSPYCERLRRSDTMKLFKWCAMDIVEFLTFLTLFSIFSAVWPHGWPVIIGLYNLCCHDASSDVHSINALVHLVVPWNFANSKLMFNVFLLLFDYVIDLD